MHQSLSTPSQSRINKESMLEKYKGIHHGMILERELKKKNLKKVAFAHALNEYPQTLNQITKGIV